MARETVILVRDARTHEGGRGGKYTDYEVYVRSTSPIFNLPESRVRRRFREFDFLRKQLVLEGITNLPELPPKKIFDRFDVDFVEQRRAALQRFLKDLLGISEVLGVKSFHLFLQTETSVEDIKYQVDDLMSPRRPGPDRAFSPEIFIINPPQPLIRSSRRTSPVGVNNDNRIRADGEYSVVGRHFVYSSMPSTVATPSPVDCLTHDQLARSMSSAASRSSTPRSLATGSSHRQSPASSHSSDSASAAVIGEVAAAK